MNSLRIVKLFIILVILISQGLPIAEAAQIPSAQTASSEEKRVVQENFLEIKEEKLDEVALSDIVEMEKELTAGGAPAIFQVKDVHFSGNTAIPSAELRLVVKNLLDRPVSFEDVRQTLFAIKLYYRQKGYLSVYAYLPKQEMENNGTLRIEILEGRLGKVEISGNKYFSTNLLTRLFPITQGKALRRSAILGFLKRLNRHPDIRTKATLVRGEERGTTDARLDVTDRRPVHLSIDMNNLGTDNTGEYRYGTSMRWTNFSGQMDEFFLRLQGNESVGAVSTSYDRPVGNGGDRLGVAASAALIEVGGQFEGLEIEGDAFTVGPYWQHPLLEWERLSIVLRAGFDFKESENRLLGIVTGQESLRVLHGAIEMDASDQLGRTYSSSRVDAGFAGVLGGSDKVDPNATRFGSGGQFLVYRGMLLRQHRLPLGMTLAFRGNLQLSSDLLPPSEQLRLGGAQSVRGYGEAEYAADHGGHGSLELYMPFPGMPKDWRLPRAKRALREEVQLEFFADAGRGSLNGTRVGEINEKSLIGVGCGLRIHLFDKFYSRVDWGFPVGGSRPANGGNSAFYFGVNYEII